MSISFCLKQGSADGDPTGEKIQGYQQGKAEQHEGVVDEGEKEQGSCCFQGKVVGQLLPSAP